EGAGAGADAEIRHQGQPLLCWAQQERAGAARQGQRDHHQGEGVGRDRQPVGEMAEGAVAARLLDAKRWGRRVTYKLQFAELLPSWNGLRQGLIFTIVLTIVSTVAGIAVGTAGASARTFGPAWLGRVVGVYVELIRNTPFIVQLFFIFFGLP